jgi:serine/threonine protein kinase
MSPEAVSGTSGMEEAKQAVERGEIGAVHTADIWALGAMLYIMQTGMTPFWCASHYLAFLKIKRCNLTRPMGIVDDEAWDLIHNLMQADPTKRLGADAFKIITERGVRRMEPKSESNGAYDMVRAHPFFSLCHGVETQIRQETPIPSLQDLCVRPIATLAYNDSCDVELCDKHPPGDGSRHDMTRLCMRNRAAVLHVLDRRKLLREQRLYSRFFVDAVASRLDKVRPATRDFVGLTQMNDDQGKAPNIMHDPYAKPMALDDLEIVQVTSPLLSRDINESCDETNRKIWIKLLKKCIANINRARPKLVVAVGYVDERCRKLLSRISDSIPVVVHNGSAFFSFWTMGVQCVAIQSCALSEGSPQCSWLREHMEQCRLSKHPLFCFVDCDPRDLPLLVTKRLARGRALSLFGLTKDSSFSVTLSYAPNEMICFSDNTDDTVSIRSEQSEEDKNDSFTMKIEGTVESGLRCIVVGQDPGDWLARFEAVELPGAGGV